MKNVLKSSFDGTLIGIGTTIVIMFLSALVMNFDKIDRLVGTILDGLNILIYVVIFSLGAGIIGGLIWFVVVRMGDYKIAQMEARQDKVIVHENTITGAPVFALIDAVTGQARLVDSSQMIGYFDNRNPDRVPGQHEGFAYHESNVTKRIIGAKTAKALPPMVEDTNPDLLEAGDETVNFLETFSFGLKQRGLIRGVVQGGAGTGKTSLMKHALDVTIQSNDPRDIQVYVIDPDAPKLNVSDSVMVIGGGQNYEAIANFIDSLMLESKARYEAGTGNEDNPLPGKPIMLFCDEWTDVVNQLTIMERWDITHALFFYTKARKAGIGYFFITHDFTVGSMGIKGNGNFRESVEFWVKIEKSIVGGVDKRIATIADDFNFKKNVMPLVIPGPYNGKSHYNKKEAAQERIKNEKYLTTESLNDEIDKNEGFIINLSDILTARQSDLEITDKEPLPALVRAAPQKTKATKGKAHPDNVNMAIDGFLLLDNPTFPSKSEVCKSLGIDMQGGAYTKAMGTYKARLETYVSEVMTGLITNETLPPLDDVITAIGATTAAQKRDVESAYTKHLINW